VADQPASALTTPLIYTLTLDSATPLPGRDRLNAAEQARLGAIRHPERAREYLASRLLIRQALCHAGGQTGATAPEFHDLPASGPPGSVAQLQWGLSHTDGHIICAVHQGRVGVDVELSNRQAPWRALARRWFSETEQHWLTARGSTRDFLLLWTLKEAWLKANHRGIAGNLQNIQLSPSAGDELQLTADTQGRAWYAATACHNGLQTTVVWEHHGTPRALICQRLAGDPATAFTDAAQSWEPTITINNGGRQS